jgi:SP family myo-inositol transporter-like MFS transporter 13
MLTQLLGYDTGVISGAILFLKSDFHLTSVEQELVISVALAGTTHYRVSNNFVGAIIGSFVGGPLSDRFGRKPIILVASFLFALGSAILAVSFHIAMLLIGRFVVGTGIGVAANIVPIYVAEIAPADARGSLVTINNLAITTGQFISYLVLNSLIYFYRCRLTLLLWMYMKDGGLC